LKFLPSEFPCRLWVSCCSCRCRGLPPPACCHPRQSGPTRQDNYYTNIII